MRILGFCRSYDYSRVETTSVHVIDPSIRLLNGAHTRGTLPVSQLVAQPCRPSQLEVGTPYLRRFCHRGVIEQPAGFAIRKSGGPIAVRQFDAQG